MLENRRKVKRGENCINCCSPGASGECWKWTAGFSEVGSPGLDKSSVAVCALGDGDGCKSLMGQDWKERRAEREGTERGTGDRERKRSPHRKGSKYVYGERERERERERKGDRK